MRTPVGSATTSAPATASPVADARRAELELGESSPSPNGERLIELVLAGEASDNATALVLDIGDALAFPSGLPAAHTQISDIGNGER